jgi:hypothetical protein
VPKNSLIILSHYQSKIKSLERIRIKQETLFADGLIAHRDIEEVYGAIYLDAMASFEALIEDLFIGLLTGKVRSRHSNVNVRVLIKDYDVARDIFFRGKYFSWLPFENTVKAAKNYFTGGRPFSFVTDEQKRSLSKCVTLRHAIAHHSYFALSKFKKEVLADLHLPPRDRRPGGFLRSQFSVTPPTTYYQQLNETIYNVALTFC